MKNLSISFAPFPPSLEDGRTHPCTCPFIHLSVFSLVKSLIKKKKKKSRTFSSRRGAAETNPTRNHEVRVQYLASLSGLRNWRCRELWCRSQTKLGSRRLQTPNLGTSVCRGRGRGPKKTKKKKKKKKEKKQRERERNH